MERFPETWFKQPLQGPLVYQGVEYVLCQSTIFPWGCVSTVYRCLLCETGCMRSDTSCLEHCRGRRHQRQYSYLVRQQTAWLQEQSVPRTFETHDGRRANEVHEDVSGYFNPFQTYYPDGVANRKVGISCQLCQTGGTVTDFANRFAVLEHCEISRRHGVLRNRTLYCGNYHPEITDTTNLLPRIQQLPSHYYRWYMERELLHYIAAKEGSMASFKSRRYAWYQVWKKLETFELRYQMSILECAIWKEHMLEYDATIQFTSLVELEEFLRDQGLDYESYRWERRKTSQAHGIIIGVIPFLQDVPKITKGTSKA